MKAVKNENLDSRDIFNKIKYKYNSKMSISYFNFLISVVNNYFNMRIPETSQVSKLMETFA